MGNCYADSHLTAIWQVIKTTSITSDCDRIVEGKAVDANWKKGEETAVAEIIKLGGK